MGAPLLLPRVLLLLVLVMALALLVEVSQALVLCGPRLHWTAASPRRGSALRGGHRRLFEVGLSGKARFRRLREALLNASAAQSVFLGGSMEAEPEVVLYCEGNVDASQRVACPFAQFAQLMLTFRNVSFVQKLTVPSPTPIMVTRADAIESLPVPRLHHKGVNVYGPLRMAQYIDEHFPDAALASFMEPSYIQVVDRTSQLYPTLHALITNREESTETQLAQAMNQQLDVMDDILRYSPGSYLCGNNITVADLYLMPQLLHAIVALLHFKRIDVYRMGTAPARPALERYIARMSGLSLFKNKRLAMGTDSIVHSWKQKQSAVH